MKGSKGSILGEAGAQAHMESMESIMASLGKRSAAVGSGAAGVWSGGLGIMPNQQIGWPGVQPLGQGPSWVPGGWPGQDPLLPWGAPAQDPWGGQDPYAGSGAPYGGQPAEIADVFKKAWEGAQDQKAAQMREAAEFGRGVEESETALGARHHLRLALSAGHAVGLIRCWSALAERGFEAQALAAGKSETLMAAALGRSPKEALEWLAAKGFEPGAGMASQAMLAMLASSPSAGGLRALVELFGAGTLEPKALAALKAAAKGLEARARANAEAYEIAGEARAPGGARGRPQRL